MKAISVRQPWANMIASGKKTIETRTWSTRYRGRLAICSSKYAKPYIPPLGCLICVVTLVDCKVMTPEDEIAAQCPCPGIGILYAWVLDDVDLYVPVKVRGKLGIYDLPFEETDLTPDHLPPPEPGTPLFGSLSHLKEAQP